MADTNNNEQNNSSGNNQTDSNVPNTDASASTNATPPVTPAPQPAQEPTPESTQEVEVIKSVENAKNVEDEVIKVISNKNIDINANIGTFTRKVVESAVISPNVAGTGKPGVNTPDPISNPQINFEKFKQKPKVTSLTADTYFKRFHIWLEKKINAKKSLLILTGIYLLVYIALILLCSLLFTYVSKNLAVTSDPINTIAIFNSYARVANVIHIIVLSTLGAPILILLIGWIIGINGIYKSVVFHMFLIALLTILILLVVTSTTLASAYLIEYGSFTRNPTATDESDANASAILQAFLSL